MPILLLIVCLIFKIDEQYVSLYCCTQQYSDSKLNFFEIFPNIQYLPGGVTAGFLSKINNSPHTRFKNIFSALRLCTVFEEIQQFFRVKQNNRGTPVSNIKGFHKLLLKTA